MAKVFTYVVIMTFIMLLLLASGMLSNSEIGAVGDIVSQNATSGEINIADYHDIGMYGFVLVLVGVLAAAAVVGVAASFFGGTTPSDGVLLAGTVGIAGAFLWGFLAAIWNVMTVANAASCTTGICGTWVSWLIVLICAPVAAGFILSVIEWIRGND